MPYLELDDALGLPWFDDPGEVCSCGGAAKARGPYGLVCWQCWVRRFALLRSAASVATSPTHSY